MAGVGERSMSYREPGSEETSGGSRTLQCSSRSCLGRFCSRTFWTSRLDLPGTTLRHRAVLELVLRYGAS